MDSLTLWLRIEALVFKLKLAAMELFDVQLPRSTPLLLLPSARSARIITVYMNTTNTLNKASPISIRIIVYLCSLRSDYQGPSTGLI